MGGNIWGMINAVASEQEIWKELAVENTTPMVGGTIVVGPIGLPVSKCGTQCSPNLGELRLVKHKLVTGGRKKREPFLYLFHMVKLYCNPLP